MVLRAGGDSDKVPGIFIHRIPRELETLHQSWGMYVSSSVNRERDFRVKYDNLLDKWQSFEISQLREGDGKVRLVRVVSRGSDERYSDLLQRQC